MKYEYTVYTNTMGKVLEMLRENCVNGWKLHTIMPNGIDYTVVLERQVVNE